MDDIAFCDLCNCSLGPEDFVDGEPMTIDGRVACGDCVAKMRHLRRDVGSSPHPAESRPIKDRPAPQGNKSPVLTKLRCLHCGSPLPLPGDADGIVCQYCGTSFLVTRHEGGSISLKTLGKDVSRIAGATEKSADANTILALGLKTKELKELREDLIDWRDASIEENQFFSNFMNSGNVFGTLGCLLPLMGFACSFILDVDNDTATLLLWICPSLAVSLFLYIRQVGALRKLKLDPEFRSASKQIYSLNREIDENEKRIRNAHL